jgi:hypothetical protein
MKIGRTHDLTCRKKNLRRYYKMTEVLEKEAVADEKTESTKDKTLTRLIFLRSLLAKICKLNQEALNLIGALQKEESTKLLLNYIKDQLKELQSTEKITTDKIKEEKNKSEMFAQIFNLAMENLFLTNTYIHLISTIRDIDQQ